jgi:hypothetical protein
MHRALLACLLMTLAPGTPWAARIALYNDATWVDSGTSTASADSLSALLSSLGHTTVAFSGVSGSGFATALGGADLVVFPEMLSFGALAESLEPGAIAALNGFVSGGGGLIATGGSANRLLNKVFYPGCDFTAVFCLASSGTGGASFLDSAVAAGTAYAAAPATLASPPTLGDAINPFAFFPAGGLDLYRDRVAGSPNSTTALTAPFGSGHYGYLAWGFAGSVPNGTLDGGWAGLLGIMTNDVAAVPEPSALLLSLAALPWLARRRGGLIPKSRPWSSSRPLC